NLIKKLYEFISDTNRLLTLVLGASGSGKSSLVKAGLIPYLDKFHNWKTLNPIRPGETPLTRLNGLVKELDDNSKTLEQAIATWSKNHPAQKLLLVIDQLEELITLCRDETEKEQFLQLLANLVTTDDNQLKIVVTLRSDFESQFSDTPLKDYWQEGRFIVPAMSRNDLREVIEEPASAKVVYFESLDDKGYLVDHLIDEVADMPGALPLLSFALSELYLKLARRYLEGQKTGDTVDRVITWQDYDELGGVIKSLTRRADEEYNALVKEDAAYETTIRHVMLRMVAIGGELARRRVYQKELVYPEPEYGRVKAFIQRFDAVRLLISDQDEKGEYVEPAHDALVTGWEKLLTWKKEEEETLILQRRLTPAAMEWDRVKDNYQTELFDKANPVINGLDRVLFPVENLLLKLIKLPADLMQKLRRSQHQQGILREKPAQFLWNSNPYLDVLDQEIHGENNWLNEAEREFIEASVLQKRRNISWRWRIAIAVMLGLSGLTIIAYIQQNLATKREKIAFARQLGSQSQIVQKEDAALLIRSTLLAVQSMQLGMEVGIRPFQAEQTLIQAKQLLPNPLPQFNLKDEDHLLNSQIALRTNEDNIQLINPINGKVIRSINCSNKCSWNINSKYLAKINNNGYVQIFDLVENKEISQLSYMNAKSISDSNSLMEFSSNGKYFGILNFKSKSLTIWNIVTKQKHSIILNQNFQGEDRYIYSSVIDNEGNFIYTEGNNQNRLELVKIDRQEKLSRIPLSTKQQILNIVSFSANGRYLIVGETNAAEQCVQVWDVDSGREILKINTDSPTDIAINANGNYLAISDRGGGLSIWDIPAGKEVKKIQYKNEGWIGGIQFSPNGKYLASYTWTIVRIHEIPSGKEISRIIHENTTSLSGFSTDGKYLLTSEDQDNGSPSQRKIWDLRD
ncbi:eIF2A-related protein, partial [Crocosphaera watsonii]